MKRWFSADLHLGHPYMALEVRGFDSVTAHDEVIVTDWNSLVGDEDLCFLAGDIAWNDEALLTLARLKGRKILIPGNHDSVFGGHRHALRAHPKWAEHVTVAGGYLRVSIGEWKCLLSHFPHWGMPEAHAPGRYKAFRPGDDGEHILLHGHTHQKTMFTEFPMGSGKMWPRSIHIGWDTHHGPVLEQTIVAAIPELLKRQGEPHD